MKSLPVLLLTVALAGCSETGGGSSSDDSDTEEALELMAAQVAALQADLADATLQLEATTTALNAASQSIQALEAGYLETQALLVAADAAILVLQSAAGASATEVAGLGVAVASHSTTIADLQGTAVRTTGSYSDPSWLTGLAGTKVTAAFGSQNLSAGGNGQIGGNLDVGGTISGAIAGLGVNTNGANESSGGDDCTLSAVQLFAGAALPDNFIPASGQAMSIAQNTALFSLLGIAYGGNGVSTFALPDLRPFAPDEMTYGICAVGIFP